MTDRAGTKSSEQARVAVDLARTSAGRRRHVRSLCVLAAVTATVLINCNGKESAEQRCQVGDDGGAVAVGCGDQVCRPPTPVCCPTKTDTVVPFRVLEGHCVTSADQCPPVFTADGGAARFLAYQCDDSADCAAGTVCCTDIQYHMSSCKTHCGRELTDTENQACKKTCECIDGSDNCLTNGKFAGFCCQPGGVHCYGFDEACCSGSCVPGDPRGTEYICQ